MSKRPFRIEDYVYYPPIPVGLVETYAGVLNGNVNTGPRLEAQLSSMWSCCLSGDGGLFASNILLHHIVKICKRGYTSIYAGRSVAGFNDGPSDEAMFSGPAAVHLHSSGILLVADKSNNKIRAIQDGRVRTFAGGSKAGDGPVMEATFSGPVAICETASGCIMVADSSSRKIRLIMGGFVTSFLPMESLDDSLNAAWRFAFDPSGLAFDEVSGITYVVNRSNNSIEAIDRNGKVRRIASNMDEEQTFRSPWTAILAPNNELIVADEYHNVVQSVDINTGKANIICGQTTSGFLDGPNDIACFRDIACVSLTPLGDILIVDRTNHLIRRTRVRRYETRNFDAESRRSFSSLMDAFYLPMTKLCLVDGHEINIHTILLSSRCPLILQSDIQKSILDLHISIQSAEIFQQYLYTDALATVDHIQISELVHISQLIDLPCLASASRRQLLFLLLTRFVSTADRKNISLELDSIAADASLVELVKRMNTELQFDPEWALNPPDNPIQNSARAYGALSRDDEFSGLNLLGSINVGSIASILETAFETLLPLHSSSVASNGLDIASSSTSCVSDSSPAEWAKPNFILKLGSNEFPCHHWALAATWTYVKDALAFGGAESSTSTLEIPVDSGFTPELVPAFLRYLYLHDLTLFNTREICCLIFDIASEFRLIDVDGNPKSDFAKLFDHCSSMLIPELTISNCIQTFQIVSKYGSALQKSHMSTVLHHYLYDLTHDPVHYAELATLGLDAVMQVLKAVSESKNR